MLPVDVLGTDHVMATEDCEQEARISEWQKKVNLAFFFKGNQQKAVFTGDKEV